MHHSKPHHHFSTLFWLHLLFFMHFMIYFELRWPWNWKALQMNSEMVENWHGIIISPTYHVQKSLEGYRKNWIHFMYKLDNLLRSIRVSDENSSITKGFHIFKHILTQDFFCIQYAPFKTTSSLFNPFLTSFAIFHAFMIYFELRWPWNWKSLQMNSEMVENWHGIVISPT